MIYLLKKKYARTNPLKYSFFHRIVDSWNLLPYDTRKVRLINNKVHSLGIMFASPRGQSDSFMC